MTEQVAKIPGQQLPFSIIKPPRKNIEFFKTGNLFKLKFNDPYKYKLRYSIVEVKQLDLIEDIKQNHSISGISTYLTTKYNVNYVFEKSAALHSADILNETFICLNYNATILRNYPTSIDGMKHNSILFKQVPVFMFHDSRNNKPIIGSVQIDLYDQDLKELFNENISDVLTPDYLIYIENFFEELTVG